MFTKVYGKDTPLGMLTLGEFAEYFKLALDKTPLTPIPAESGKRYVYGLKGIQELFHVSHKTAQAYKDGFLKDAVYQNGRKIMVDAEKAISLFNARG